MQDGKLDKEAVRELWEQDTSISGDLLKKILKTLKWDIETFYAAYRREISDKDAAVDPDREELEALARFEESLDYDQLLFRLGTSHPVIADSVVSRTMLYRHLPH